MLHFFSGEHMIEKLLHHRIFSKFFVEGAKTVHWISVSKKIIGIESCLAVTEVCQFLQRQHPGGCSRYCQLEDDGSDVRGFGGFVEIMRLPHGRCYTSATTSLSRLRLDCFFS
jgi:hypothetical protein